MIIVQHRMNTIKQLRGCKKDWGVEIDIRNHGNGLLLVHDPFEMQGAVELSDWLSFYNHKFLIANVKEEGLETKLLPLFNYYGVDDFFILDETIPYIMKYAACGVSKFALRVSEFESIETALLVNENCLNNGTKIDWVWVDSFTGKPLPLHILTRLKELGFKLCQVSPELHHIEDPQSWENRIAEFQTVYGSSYAPDMVCTKRPELWCNINEIK
jgi:hypothetical protein